MKYELFSRVALAVDVPEYGLLKGDLVTVVEILPANPGHANGYLVEIVSVTGQTLDVIGLHETQLTPLRPNAIPNMREFAEAA